MGLCCRQMAMLFNAGGKRSKGKQIRVSESSETRNMVVYELQSTWYFHYLDDWHTLSLRRRILRITKSMKEYRSCRKRWLKSVVGMSACVCVGGWVCVFLSSSCPNFHPSVSSFCHNVSVVSLDSWSYLRKSCLLIVMVIVFPCLVGVSLVDLTVLVWLVNVDISVVSWTLLSYTPLAPASVPS